MTKKELLGLVLVIAIFVLVSYFAREYSDFLEIAVSEKGFLGMFIYVLITVIEVVIAPLSTLPLIPIASFAWGGFIAAVLTILGWVIGSSVAFVLAKEYGKPLISKFLSLEKIEKLERALPHENIFWSIVFLRIAIPVDLLSYALGLFTKVRLSTYTLATIIGVTPFAFIFSYAAVLPISYQIGAGILALIAIYLGYKKIKKGYTSYSDSKPIK